MTGKGRSAYGERRILQVESPVLPFPIPQTGDSRTDLEKRWESKVDVVLLCSYEAKDALDL